MEADNEKDIERMRAREREREREKNEKTEGNICFCKRFFSSLGARATSGKNAAILNLGNKPIKMNWTLS